MIYLVCFGISVLFAYLARTARNRTNLIVCSVLSIAVTAALAGLRDISIGIDTQNYYILPQYWNGAMRYSGDSLLEYLRYFRSRSQSNTEILFALLIGVVAKTTRNYHVLLLLVHLIIVGGVYIGAFRMRAHANPEFTLLLFYLLYYNHSLNIYRQYMAMAIIFAAAADIEQRKYLRYVVFVALAFMIHTSGILGLAPMLIYIVLYPGKRLKRASLQRRVLLCVLLLGAVYAFVPVVQLLIRVGFLSRKYLYYLNSEEASSYVMVLLFLLVEAFGIILFWRSFQDCDPRADFFLFCSAAFVLVFQMASVIHYGKRIAAYFSLLNLVSLGILAKCPKLPGNRPVVRASIILVVLVYWGYVFAFRNASQTMPYIFGLW